MRLLISDANVLIDLDIGGVLECLFLLRDYRFAVPDVLFAEELVKHHPQLPELGLELLTLGAPAISETLALTTRYAGSGVSLNDLMTLALARQEGCPVLTGDRVLRRIAGDEGVAVMGTLWLIERLVAGEVIGVTEAQSAYARMRAGGRRLPWDQVQRQIDRLGGGDL